MRSTEFSHKLEILRVELILIGFRKPKGPEVDISSVRDRTPNRGLVNWSKAVALSCQGEYRRRVHA